MRYIIAALLFPVYLLSHFIPTRDDYWLFTSETGSAKGYADNTKHLFKYVYDDTDKSAVWLSEKQDVRKTLSSKGYRTYSPTSLCGIYYTLRSGVTFRTRSIFCSDARWYLMGAGTHVQLWHGVPMKKIDPIVSDDTLVDRVMSWVSRFDMFTLTSDQDPRQIFTNANVDPAKMVVTGYPRNDAIFDNTSGTIPARVSSIPDGSQTVLYLPTFREDGEVFKDSDIDLEILDAELADCDSYFLVKPHENSNGALAEYDRVRALDSSMDIYPMLSEIDVLITDYSSVCFDYLLTDGKLLFYPYDLVEYSETRGFCIDYDAVAAGPQALTFDELLIWIAHFAEGEDGFQSRREDITTRFHTYRDGNSAQRVVEAVEKL